MAYQIKLQGAWVTVRESIFLSWGGERRVDGIAAEQVEPFADAAARDEALWHAEVSR